MQTKIMLTLTVVVIAGAWAALAGGKRHPRPPLHIYCSVLRAGG